MCSSWIPAVKARDRRENTRRARRMSELADRLGEALSPAAASRLRQIHEGTLVDLVALESSAASFSGSGLTVTMAAAMSTLPLASPGYS
jgi:hypothetical protein